MTTVGQQRRLVFDVGMCHGDDTAWYLRRGFRVVGVEANPALVPGLHRRFHTDIDAGNLVIVNKAIARQPGRIQLGVPAVAALASLEREFIEFSEEITEAPVDYVEVEAIRFETLLEEFGVPYYLKIDIEGSDLLCVEALRGSERKPAFLSVESAATGPDSTLAKVRAEIDLLAELGYRRFTYVEQWGMRWDGTRLVDGEGAPVEYQYDEEVSGPFGLDLDRRWVGRRQCVVAGSVLALRTHLFAMKRGRRAWSPPSSAVRWVADVVARRAERPRLGAAFHTFFHDLHAAHASVVDRLR